jgi:hypothetical protein
MKPHRLQIHPILALLAAAAVFAGGPCLHAGQSISGWFVKTTINTYSSVYNCTFYIFFSNGHMYFGNPPAGTEKIKYGELYKADPKNCGIYKLDGVKLTWTRNDGSAPEEHIYSPKFGGTMDGSPLSPVWRFDNGARLEGRWGIDTAFTGSGFSSSSSTSFVFHRDGTFETAGHAGVDGKQDTGLETTAGKGTYAFKGAKLIMKYDGGATRSLDAFGTDTKAAPRILGIDGMQYTAGG